MHIQVYAILKDYFDKEFVINEPMTDIKALNSILSGQNPSAKDILAGCRYAVNDTIVDEQFQLRPGDSIHIIPPSSGG